MCERCNCDLLKTCFNSAAMFAEFTEIKKPVETVKSSVDIDFVPNILQKFHIFSKDNRRFVSSTEISNTLARILPAHADYMSTVLWQMVTSAKLSKTR